MTNKMPVLFIGHGNPMNAIEENPFSNSWIEMGKKLPTPKAIIAVSAHWETLGTKVTAMEKPKTIHDFGGFPQVLFDYQYPAPGSPQLVRSIREIIKNTPVEADTTWGLDHGTWSVLARLFPNANVPVVQLSLDRQKTPLQHYQLGRELSELRDEDVLIVSSGNIVHNLRSVVFNDEEKYPWAVSFDEKVKNWILTDDHEPLIQYEKHGQEAALAINSAEHYLPLLYTMGLKSEGESIEFFADKVTYGSLSMRSVKLG
jgi:4,5-DOPA dioxygenase extradiol